MTYVYKVTQRWHLAPAEVTQLVPTSGYDLTLVPCDPWWQDHNRLVWRAELVSSPAVRGGSPPEAGASPSTPSFSQLAAALSWSQALRLRRSPVSRLSTPRGRRKAVISVPEQLWCAAPHRPPPDGGRHRGR